MHRCRSLVVCLLLLGSICHVSAQAVPPPPAAVDASTRSAVVEALGKQLKANYVFPQVADKVAVELSANAAHGAYNGSKTTDVFANTLTADLGRTGQDRHLRVLYDPSFKASTGDQKAPTQEDVEETRKFVLHMGFGIAKVERLPGNVGYLDLRAFPPAEFVTGAYASAMSLLSGTDALILDLRLNGGGDPASVANLLSYFFTEGDSRHLNDLYWRHDNSTQQFWTIPVAGARYTKPVYVLTSAYTFSGGEECAYDFQTQKRATLVGQATGGGANPGDTFSLGHGFVAFIPTGRAINPITKTNWEHVGVKPDVTVPAADAMKTAYANILETLIQKTKDNGQRDALQRTLARVRKGEDEKPNYEPPTQ